MTSRASFFRLSIAALILAAAASEAEAQRRLTFNPYLYLEQTYTDNVRFTTDGDSDTFTRLAVVLPVTYDLRRSGGLTASYEFFVDRFARFDDLDSTGHRFNLGYHVKPSQPSHFQIGVSYLRRDDQGLIGSTLQEDLFLTPRLRREVGRAAASYRYRLGPTWALGFGLSYVEYDFERITGRQQDDLLIGVQSRRGWIYDATVEKRLSDRTTTGLGYTLEDFTLDPIEGDDRFNMTGDERIQTVFALWRHTLGPLWRFDARLGVFRREGTGSDGRDLFREGAIGRFNAFRRFPTTELELYAIYAPTTQGLLRGTSTVTTVGAALRDKTPGRWDWRVYSQYSLREPSITTDPDIETLNVGGEVQWALQRLLTLRLTSLYINQMSDTGFAEREFYRISLALFYFPLGRTQIGGAPAVPFADTFEE